MDEETRLERREQSRRRTRRHRGAALAVLAAAVAAVGALVAAGGDEEAQPGAETAAARPPELPRGGRSIFPDHRVVAFYGAPQDPELGALGVGRPAAAARRLRRQARSYARPGERPVLPAFELITTIVQSDPGDDGDHSARLEPATIERYLRAARRNRMLLILDIQPGYAPFMREVRALERYLEEPDVSLALDPEWSMRPPQLPGQEIGSTDAATVNEISAYLARIVRRERLPQKLLVVHRFTDDMIENERALKRHPGVALTVNVDGFGDRANKVAKYRSFTRDRRRRHYGFKLFYEEDTNLMRPRQVLRLRPAPELVVYE